MRGSGAAPPAAPGPAEDAGEDAGEEEKIVDDTFPSEKEEIDNSANEDNLKDDYINITIAPSSKHILDVTSQFSKDIHNHFDLLTQFYNDKITTYENRISKLDIQYNEMNAKYNTECEDHNNTKEELNKLRIKFEGIKSLFN